MHCRPHGSCVILAEYPAGQHVEPFTIERTTDDEAVARDVQAWEDAGLWNDSGPLLARPQRPARVLLDQAGDPDEVPTATSANVPQRRP
jgi:hypothetical protein